jgi:hypothetical protein
MNIYIFRAVIQMFKEFRRKTFAQRKDKTRTAIYFLFIDLNDESFLFGPADFFAKRLGQASQPVLANRGDAHDANPEVHIFL